MSWIQRHPEHDELQSDTGTVYHFLIVMPAAQLDLSYELSHSQTAGGNLDGVVDLMRQVGTHLQYMHVHGRIHGDLKARNIVKVTSTAALPGSSLTSTTLVAAAPQLRTK